MKLAVILVLLSAQVIMAAPQYLITFEGWTNHGPVSTASINAGLQGAAMTWQFSGSTSGMIHTNDGQKPLLSPVTVAGTDRDGVGYFGLRSDTATGGQYVIGFQTNGDAGAKRASIGAWIWTDAPTNAAGNWDVFTVTGTNGSSFVNAILYIPGDGTTAQIAMETQSGTSGGTNVHIQTGLGKRYWINIGYGIGGSTNAIRVYDSQLTLVGVCERVFDQATNAWYLAFGVTSGPGGTSHVWHDNILADFSDTPTWPLLPGSFPIKPAWPLTSTNSVTWTLGTHTGVSGGIPARETIYTNLTDTALTTTLVINDAIANCPSNQTVKLGPGRFTNVLQQVSFWPYHGITLRGTRGTVAGTNPTVDTILIPTNMVGSAYINMGLETSENAGTKITNGWTRGSTNLIVESTTGLVLGQLIHIDAVMDMSFMWDSSNDGTARQVSQNAEIHNIVGNTVTIWPPLTHTLTASPLLKHYGATTYQLKRCGIEDITIDCTTSNVGYGIVMEQTIGCWIKNVRLINVTGYANYNLRSVNGEISKLFIDQQPDYGSSHGGILLGSGNGVNTCTGFAVYDCILYRAQPGIQVNGGSSGNVIAYNFAYDTQYSDGTQVPGIDLNHGGVNNMNLYEGNVANMMDTDGNFSGNLNDTVFRNWLTGWTPTSTNYSSRCLSIAHFGYGMNVVGNILGSTNVGTPDHYSRTNPITATTSTVLMLGFPDGTGNGTYTGQRPPTIERSDTLDLYVTNSALFHGNWDSKNAVQSWDADRSNKDLPQSLYLNTKPTWFGNLNWPFNPTNGWTNLVLETSVPGAVRFFTGQDPSLVSIPSRTGHTRGKGRNGVR